MMRQAMLVAVHAPLKLMYRNAPAALGGWDGRDDADVCAQLTGSKADFWHVNPRECEDMIERHFMARFTMLLCAAYMCAVWAVVASMWRLVCTYIESRFIRPTPMVAYAVAWPPQQPSPQQLPPQQPPQPAMLALPAQQRDTQRRRLSSAWLQSSSKSARATQLLRAAALRRQLKHKQPNFHGQPGHLAQ